MLCVTYRRVSARKTQLQCISNHSFFSVFPVLTHRHSTSQLFTIMPSIRTDDWTSKYQHLFSIFSYIKLITIFLIYIYISYFAILVSYFCNGDMELVIHIQSVITYFCSNVFLYQKPGNYFGQPWSAKNDVTVMLPPLCHYWTSSVWHFIVSGW